MTYLQRQQDDGQALLVGWAQQLEDEVDERQVAGLGRAIRLLCDPCKTGDSGRGCRGQGEPGQRRHDAPGWRAIRTRGRGQAAGLIWAAPCARRWCSSCSAFRWRGQAWREGAGGRRRVSPTCPTGHVYARGRRWSRSTQAVARPTAASDASGRG